MIVISKYETLDQWVGRPLCNVCYQDYNQESPISPGTIWFVGPFCHVCCDHQTSNNQNHQPGINWLVCSLPASVTAHTEQLRSILCRPVEKHTEDLVIIEEMTKDI